MITTVSVFLTLHEGRSEDDLLVMFQVRISVMQAGLRFTGVGVSKRAFQAIVDGKSRAKYNQKPFGNNRVLHCDENVKFSDRVGNGSALNLAELISDYGNSVIHHAFVCRSR